MMGVVGILSRPVLVALLLLVVLGVWASSAAFVSTNPNNKNAAVSLRTQKTTSTTAVYLEAPGFLTDLLKNIPGSGGGSNADNEDVAPLSPTQPFDGSDASLFAQAKKFLQSDLGLQEPDLLDDENFAWLGPNVDTPLSKTEYLAAGRFFNLRKAFPDLDYRGYDYRLVDDENTIRLTCRVTGTMRGELRLRSGVLLPTGKTMRCPPEAVSITFDRNSGKVTKLCSGFVLDRLVGNTEGTCGVQAASIIAGQDVSPFEVLPATTVLGRILARPAKPIPETTNFLAPFPETVMVQLAKGVIANGMASQDPTLLSDDFTFCTPTIGPVRTDIFLEKYARQEFDNGTIEPNFENYRVDPYDPVRVWVDMRPTAAGVYEGAPQVMSLAFDEDGYCTRITSWAVMDPSVGNGGGLGGPEGYRYATGQGSLGLAARPLPRSLGRVAKRLLSPITGTSVDEYKPRQRGRKIFAAPTATSTAPTPPVTPPAMPKKETPNEVIQRLEGLGKGISSSIKIIPERISRSFPIRPPPTDTSTTASKPRVSTSPKKSSPPKKPISPMTPPKTVASKKETPNEVIQRLEGIGKGISSSIRVIPEAISRSFSVRPPPTGKPSPKVEDKKAAAKAKADAKARAVAEAKKAAEAKAKEARARREEAERERIKNAAAIREKKLAEQQAVDEKKRQAEEERKQRQAEQQQLAAERQAEAEQRRAIALAEAEAQKAKAERKKLEANLARQAEADRQKQEAEERRAAAKAEAERKRKESEEKRAAALAAAEEKRAAAEAKKAAAAKAAEEKRAAAEAKKAAAEAQRAAAAKAAEDKRAAAEAKKAAAEEKRAAAAKAAEEKRAAVLAAAEAKKEQERQAAIQRAAERRKKEQEAERKREEEEARRLASQAATKKEQEAKLAEIRAATESRKAAEREAKLAKAKAAKAKSKLAEAAEKAASRKSAGQSITIPLFQTQKSPSKPVASSTPSKPVTTPPPSSVSRSIPLTNLAQGTVSLFGFGKTELDELPPARKEMTGSSSSSVGGAATKQQKKAPAGVPTLNRWRYNKDKSISGLVSGSRNFDEGERITTSPIASGTIASGEVVKTGSGSRYFLA